MNVGKTSLFNELTDSFMHVGNWHGVTVESAEKTFARGDTLIQMQDLPGIYSLTAVSPEEVVSRDAILSGEYDVLINVCEVNNLCRNLYFTLQLLELDAPFVIAVNMVDELERTGKTIDYKYISDRLGVPVIPVSAKYRGGADKLADAAIARAAARRARVRLGYLDKLPLKQVAAIIAPNCAGTGYGLEWCAVKALERDAYVLDALGLTAAQTAAIERLGDTQSALAEARYGFITEITDRAVKPPAATAPGTRKRASGSSPGYPVIDKVLLNKYLALPIFLLIMALIFFLTFAEISVPFSYLPGEGFENMPVMPGAYLRMHIGWVIRNALYEPAVNLLAHINAPEWTIALFASGVINGVGGVAAFLPQIVLLFFFLALLEDTGYMSRVAFMTDGIFGRAGLSGRSAFTLMMGFGCSAAAVLTARNLESEAVRKKTVLLTPFMSCSARMPVYALIASPFFGELSFLVILSVYVIGIAAALLWAWILNRIPALKAEQPDFIMEMPPYRLPTAVRVSKIIAANAEAFLIRVGTLIFAMSVIMWILSNFTFCFAYVDGGAHSMLGVLGGALAVLFRPLGFGTWQAAGSLLSGLIAKEIVAESLVSMAGAAGGSLSGFFASPAGAYAYLVFVLLYVPCIAAVGEIAKELGCKLAAASAAMQLGTAYIFAYIAYRLGLFFTARDFGAIISIVISAVLIIAAARILYGLLRKGKLCRGCSGRGNCRVCKGGKKDCK
jgi:ferrous iron transport protein B